MSAHRHPSALPLLSAAVVICLLAPGCGARIYQPSTGFKFDLNPAMEINDADIRKAFSSRPQMGSTIRVAYYSFDPKPERLDELEKMLRAQSGVADVYRIPTVMVSGRRRFDSRPPPYARPAAKPMSVKKLRLLAARARCDVMVVFDYAHKIETSANGWAALNVLVLPLLFAPYLDKKVDSYLESFIVDTRNGYLYGHITSQKKGEARRVTIYTSTDDEMVKAQWAKLLESTGKALTRLFASQHKKGEPGGVGEQASASKRGAARVGRDPGQV